MKVHRGRMIKFYIWWTLPLIGRGKCPYKLRRPLGTCNGTLPPIVESSDRPCDS